MTPSLEKNVLPQFSTEFKFTLVLHSSGCHVDNFSRKKPVGELSSSLKNKICFCIRDNLSSCTRGNLSSRTRVNLKRFFGSRRYGGGAGFLTFGILDWRGNRSSRTRRAAKRIYLSSFE